MEEITRPWYFEGGDQDTGETSYHKVYTPEIATFGKIWIVRELPNTDNQRSSE